MLIGPIVNYFSDSRSDVLNEYQIGVPTLPIRLQVRNMSQQPFFESCYGLPSVNSRCFSLSYRSAKSRNLNTVAISSLLLELFMYKTSSARAIPWPMLSIWESFWSLQESRVLLYKDSSHFAWYVSSYVTSSLVVSAQLSQQLFICDLKYLLHNTILTSQLLCIRSTLIYYL